MKITKLEVIKVKPRWMFLKMYTDTDIVGLGEPILEGHANAIEANEEKKTVVYVLDDNGGAQQIAARIAYNEIDMVLIFVDPNQRMPHEDVQNIMLLCDKNNIPYGSNLASAEMLVLGLARGDLDWRDIVNPKNKPFTA